MPKKTNDNQQEVSVPPFFIECRAAPDTLNEDNRTVNVVYATETKVPRYDFVNDEHYYEVLSVKKGHVRLGEINNGAPVLDSHNRFSISHVLGTVESATEEEATLRFGRDEKSEEAFQKVKDGIVKKVSVGYRIFKLERDGEYNGLPVYRATDWEPFEISLVPVPADNQAEVRSDNVANKNSCIVINPIAASRGNNLNIKEKTTMPDDIKQETSQVEDNRAADPQKTAPDTKQEAPKVDSKRIAEEATRAEQIRTAGILEITEKHDLGKEFQKRMIEEGRSLSYVREAALDAIAEKVESVQTRSTCKVGEDHSKNSRNQGVAEYLLHRADPQNFEMTEMARQYAGFSLMNIAREFVDNTRRMNDMDIAERSLHSTSDLSNVFLDAMNKMATTQFAVSEERTHTLWARRKTASDFKTMHNIIVDGDFGLKEIRENGEYKSTTLKDSKEGYKITQLGRKINIGFQMLINDDMGVLSEIFPAFLSGAIQAELDAVYGILINNTAMADGTAFNHADHDNLISDAFSIAGLTAMRKKLRAQKTLSDKRLSLPLDFVLIGDDQEDLADRIQSSEYTPASVNDVNPYGPKGRRKLQFIYEPRISDVSATAWFGGSNNPAAKHISYAHLNGYEAPTITQVPQADPDGISFACRHFFGAGIDDRYLIKSTGA